MFPLALRRRMVRELVQSIEESCSQLEVTGVEFSEIVVEVAQRLGYRTPEPTGQAETEEMYNGS